MREHRNRGEEVVEPAFASESRTITRAGSPVATLLALRKRPLDRATLLELWLRLPPIDLRAFRNDVDTLLGSTL